MNEVLLFNTNTNMLKSAIIVAGGIGTRMQSEVPKQFIELNGLPILMRTLTAFYRYEESINLFLTLPANYVSLWERMKEKYNFDLPHNIVEGGETRFHSVKNALSHINDGLVAIHDGVRPFIKKSIIANSFKEAETQNSAVVSVALKDSIRHQVANTNSAVPRNEFRLIQTPQTFNVKLLKEAFTQAYDPIFTDDANVFEKNGHAINLIEGDYDNIKITTPEDLRFAQVIEPNFVYE